MSKVIIDSREKNKKILKGLCTTFDKVEVETLKVGDYWVGKCGVERKSISDFFTSLYSSKLFQQVEELEKEYHEAFFVITHSSAGLSLPGKKRNVFWGTIVSLQKKYNVSVTIINEGDFPFYLKFLTKDYKRKRKHSSIRPHPKTQDWEMHILTAFPGVGKIIAGRIRGKYGTLNKFFRSRMNIKGLGKNNRVKIKAIINGGKIMPEKECPECGAFLVHQEGCNLCYNCGFSKCY